MRVLFLYSSVYSEEIGNVHLAKIRLRQQQNRGLDFYFFFNCLGSGMITFRFLVSLLLLFYFELLNAVETAQTCRAISVQ